MAAYLHSVCETPDSVLYIAQKELGLRGFQRPTWEFCWGGGKLSSGRIRMSRSSLAPAQVPGQPELHQLELELSITAPA